MNWVKFFFIYFNFVLDLESIPRPLQNQPGSCFLANRSNTTKVSGDPTYSDQPCKREEFPERFGRPGYIDYPAVNYEKDYMSSSSSPYQQIGPSYSPYNTRNNVMLTPPMSPIVMSSMRNSVISQNVSSMAASSNAHAQTLPSYQNGDLSYFDHVGQNGGKGYQTSLRTGGYFAPYSSYYTPSVLYPNYTNIPYYSGREGHMGSYSGVEQDESYYRSCAVGSKGPGSTMEIQEGTLALHGQSYGTYPSHAPQGGKHWLNMAVITGNRQWWRYGGGGGDCTQKWFAPLVNRKYLIGEKIDEFMYIFPHETILPILLPPSVKIMVAPLETEELLPHVS